MKPLEPENIPSNPAPDRPAPAALPPASGTPTADHASLAATPSPAASPPKERRDFFAEAMREMLMPFAGIIEKKIAPFLEALELIPDQAERLVDSSFGLLDQPQPRRLPAVRTQSLPQRYLRPPGAMDPDDFESVCSRCGKCVEACPVDAIKLDPAGLAGEGFPYIVPAEQPCVVSTGLPCVKACPTGALRMLLPPAPPVPPEPPRPPIHMGTAKVDHPLCLRDNGENCTLCLDVCPIDSRNGDPVSALFISPQTGRVRVRRNVCIGCGMCENRCPTEPRAITVTPFAAPLDPIIA